MNWFGQHEHCVVAAVVGSFEGGVVFQPGVREIDIIHVIRLVRCENLCSRSGNKLWMGRVTKRKTNRDNYCTYTAQL